MVMDFKWDVEMAPRGTCWHSTSRTNEGISRRDSIISLTRVFYRNPRLYIWSLTIGRLKIVWGRKPDDN